MWGGDAPPSGEGMSFSFNFGGEADAEPARAVDTKATTTSEDVIPGIEVLSVEVPFPTPGWTPETVQIGKHEFVKGASSGAKYASVTDLNLDGKQSSTSDLVKGKYEGGAKLWECAIDLCEYLLRMTTDKESLKNANVLELGCGHGLPGIVCVKLGAGHVTFADYNPDVLRSLTVPNVRANETKKECNRCSYRFARSSDFLHPKIFQHLFSIRTLCVRARAELAHVPAILRECVANPQGFQQLHHVFWRF